MHQGFTITLHLWVWVNLNHEMVCIYFYRNRFISLTTFLAWLKKRLLPMTTTNETSKPRAADPINVVIGSTLVTPGSSAFSVLEGKENIFMEGYRQTNPNLSAQDPAAEAKTVPPVAGGCDWFEIAGLTLVAEGHISETRFRRAMEAARQAVARE